MRLSCCAYSYREALRSGALTLFDFLRVCREMGCDGVELTAYYFPSTERAYLNALKLQAHGEGLAISGTAIGSDFAHPEAEKRAEQVALAKAWIERSVVLGAPTLRVFAGAVREGHSEAETRAQVAACLQECAAHAQEHGVLLALENHGGLTATAEGTLRLRAAVNHPALGLNLDFGNFSGDVYGQFADCAPYACATHAKPHIHDSDPAQREAVDYKRVRAILEAAGYRGFVAMEYEEPENAASAVPRFAAALRQALG